MRTLALIVLAVLPMTACSNDQAVAAATVERSFDVYKDPTCGCCAAWVQHIELAGYTATTHDLADMSPVKQKHRIGPRYQSCHTAVSAEGYVFEGHVPARFVRQFLADPPAGSIGLSVPGMPVGSPGMEYEDKFLPYQVLLLKQDGSAEVFATVDTSAQQFE